MDNAEAFFSTAVTVTIRSPWEAEFCGRDIGCGDQLAHARDSAAPQLLVLVEQATRDQQGLQVRLHDLSATDALLAHQARPLEDRDVLLHRGEAHGVVAGELGDAFCAIDGPTHDVPPRGVGQGSEHRVVVGEELHHIQPYGCTMEKSRARLRR